LARAINVIASKWESGILSAILLKTLYFCMGSNPINVPVPDKSQSPARKNGMEGSLPRGVLKVD
jgi:hypothetical protein